jgi:hypothetical protein
MAALGKILTLDNLRKRNIIVVDWFCMCKICEESINHLFLHCEVATKMWSAFLQLFSVVWVMPHRVNELLGSWRGQMGNRSVALMEDDSIVFDVVSLARA